MTHLDYAIQATKGIREIFNNGVQEDLNQYKDNRIFDFYNTTEVFEIFTSTEGMTGVKELSELETPPTLTLEDGYSVTIEERRFGGSITLSERMYARDGADSTMKVDNYLTQQAAQLMKDSVHYFLDESFELLNDGFTGAKYLAPDGKAIFADDHAWKSGATFNNETTAVFSESALDDAWEYAGAATDPSGKPRPLNWSMIVVKKGSAAARTAKKLLAESISPVAVGDINIYEGSMTVVETPYIKYDNRLNWFLRDESRPNPLKVGIGQYPTLHEPQVEKNLAVTTAVTGFFKLGCVDMPISWFGSTGSA